MTAPLLPPCPLCGGTEWRHNSVLWPELGEQWCLAPEEYAYIDRQQGTCCCQCGAQVRVAALAEALRREFRWSRPFGEMLRRRPWLRILEVNEAGALSGPLSRYRRHVQTSYPEVDLQSLPFASSSFDVVVHSDTLEHVDDPLAGLSECLRVLRPGGVLAYTVPIVQGRLTRRRLPDEEPSYHGLEETQEYLVHTEYGADAWTELTAVGFDRVAMTSFAPPAGLALSCRAPRRRTRPE